jgi:hypothetical protein
MPTWKKRYMILEAYGVGPRQTAKISYYKSTKTDVPPQGIITLEGASVGVPSSEWVELKWYEFTVCTVAGKMYPMRVDNRSERDEWRKRIAEAVRRAAGIPPTAPLTRPASQKNVISQNKPVTDEIPVNVKSFSAQACLDQQAERDRIAQQYSQSPGVTPTTSTTPSTIKEDQQEQVEETVDSSAFHDGINFAYAPRIVPPAPAPSALRRRDHDGAGHVSRVVQFPQSVIEEQQQRSGAQTTSNRTPISAARKRAQTSLESTLMFEDWMINAGLQEHIEPFKSNNICTLRDIVTSSLIDEEGFLVYQIG